MPRQRQEDRPNHTAANRPKMPASKQASIWVGQHVMQHFWLGENKTRAEQTEARETELFY